MTDTNPLSALPDGQIIQAASGAITVKNAIILGYMPSVTSITGTTYTLGLGDANYFQICSNGSSQAITIPPNSSVAFPTDTEIAFFQQGAGQVGFVAGAGVTIQSISGYLNISARYGMVTLKKINTNTWALLGNLGA